MRDFSAVSARTLTFLRVGWNVRHADAGDGLWLLFAPYSAGNATWLLGENGGEVNLWKPNTDTHRAVPYTSDSAPLNAATMAYRIAQMLFGGSVDWQVRWPDSDFLGVAVREGEAGE